MRIPTYNRSVRRLCAPHEKDDPFIGPFLCRLASVRLAYLPGSVRSVPRTAANRSGLSTWGRWSRSPDAPLYRSRVGITLGPTWIMSRMMLVALFPPEKVGELFGLYTLAGRFSAVTVPAHAGIIPDRLQCSWPWCVPALFRW